MLIEAILRLSYSPTYFVAYQEEGVDLLAVQGLEERDELRGEALHGGGGPRRVL